MTGKQTTLSVLMAALVVFSTVIAGFGALGGVGVASAVTNDNCKDEGASYLGETAQTMTSVVPAFNLDDQITASIDLAKCLGSKIGLSFDNDDLTEEQELHTDAARLASSEDNLIVGRSNYAYDTQWTVMSDARNQIAESLQNGETKSTAKTEATNAGVNTLSNKQRNTIKMEEQHVLATYDFFQKIEDASSDTNYSVEAQPAGVGQTAYSPDISPSEANSVVAADGSGDYTSISTAITNTADGGTIYVKAGTYDVGSGITGSAITVSKNLTIVGEDGAKVVGGATAGIFNTDTSGTTLTVKGLYIENNGTSSYKGEAFRTDGGTLKASYNTMNVVNDAGSGGVSYAVYQATGTMDLADSWMEHSGSLSGGSATVTNSHATAPLTIDPTTVGKNSISVSLYNGNAVDTTTLTVGDGSGNTVTLGEYTDDSGETDTEWKLVAQPPTSSNDPKTLMNEAEWEGVFGDFQSTHSYLDSNIPPLTDNIYADYNSGDVSIAEVQGYDGLAKQAAGSGDLEMVTAYQLITGNAGNLSATQTIELSPGDNTSNTRTGYVLVGDPSKLPSDGPNSTTGFATQTTYNVKNLGTDVYFAYVNDNGKTVIEPVSGDFAFTSATNDKGESIARWEVEHYSYKNASNTDYKEQQKLQQAVEETVEENTSSGGGGSGGSGFLSGIVDALGAVGVFVVVILSLIALIKITE